MTVKVEDPRVSGSPRLKSAVAIAHPLAFKLDHVRTALDSSSDTPILLIQAPAGFGKTTVLSLVAAEDRTAVRWLRLDEQDRSLNAIISSLVSSIYGWPVPRPEAVSDVREAAKWIVGAIAELHITTIVLDDFETVATSDEVNDLVMAVAEKLPPYLRFVVASEQPPGFLRTARLRQMIAELDESDLRFDADDVARYFREIHKYDITDAAASSIARRSAGCATVVNLVGQLCHDLPRYLRVDFEALPLGPTDEHMTVLLREVLARGGHPPVRVARQLAAGLVGTPGGTSPSDAVLDFLEERHCLAQGYDTDPPIVEAHKIVARLAARM